MKYNLLLITFILLPAIALATWGPEDFIKAANNEELEYFDKSLWTGADSVKTCVFRNSQVFVAYDGCLNSGKEAPAMGMKIISISSGTLDLYIENSDGSDPISTLKRSEYDRNWRISFYQSKALNPKLISSSKDLDLFFNKSKSEGLCFVGGMLSKTGDPYCNNKVDEKSKSIWFSEGLEFWKEPSNAWYDLQKKMRKKILDALD